MKYLFPIAAILLLAACNLTKDVNITLPEYDIQPVVECYLEPGKPFRLLLTRSYGFFDPLGIDSTFIQRTLWQGATATITYNGQTDTLRNVNSFEINPVKFYNYTGSNIVPSTPGIQYDLHIHVPDRGEITAHTTMLSLVQIDSVVINWDGKTDTTARARALTYITDDLKTSDYYRRIYNKHSIDSMPKQDFLSTDALSTNATIAFGTGYSIKEGDTIFNTICHIDKAFYDFRLSVSLALQGNDNPFAQPSSIRSNVSGSANPLGVFTCLVYDRKMNVVKR
jgi:hypothetical protein